MSDDIYQLLALTGDPFLCEDYARTHGLTERAREAGFAVNMYMQAVDNSRAPISRQAQQERLEQNTHLRDHAASSRFVRQQGGSSRDHVGGHNFSVAESERVFSGGAWEASENDCTVFSSEAKNAVKSIINSENNFTALTPAQNYAERSAEDKFCKLMDSKMTANELAAKWGPGEDAKLAKLERTLPTLDFSRAPQFKGSFEKYVNLLKEVQSQASYH